MRRENTTKDRERLEHMLHAGRDAVAISQGYQRSDLDHNLMLQHALVHCVEVIGEAAARVSEAGRQRVPGIPWPRMVGMRHILVHAYFRVDYDAVWGVITTHIPQMLPLLEQALASWPEP